MLFGHEIEGNIIFQDKKFDKYYIRKMVKRYKKNLNKLCCKKEDVVAICLERGIEFVICVLACLESGITFLPIDTAHPQKRIKYMLNNAGIKLLVTEDSAFEEEFSICSIEKLTVKNYFGIRKKYVSDIAYILYTSGTTGLPKGVEVTRRGFENQLCYLPNHINMEGCKSVLALSSFSFDVFLLETVIPLYYGMNVVLADQKEQNNPKKICKLIRKYDIDFLQTTPSRLRLINAVDSNYCFLSSLKTICVGGEPFPSNVLTNLQKKTSARIFNLYGPTETTMWATVSELTDKANVDIGKPIENMELFIWNEKKQNVQLNQCGELVIGGVGVAKGYINNQEETNKRFIIDSKLNKRVYLTGDIVKFDNNGDLLFLGRKDNQIKHLGNRIELEEIDKCLEKIEGIDIGITCYDYESKKIIAFIKKSKELNENNIFEMLKQYLPKYMIPEKIVSIDQLNYTRTGKIDRKKILQNFVNQGDDKKNETNGKTIFTNYVEQILGRTIDTSIPILDINIDSILYVELIVKLEEKYNIEFETEKLSVSEFECFDEIYEYIMEKID